MKLQLHRKFKEKVNLPKVAHNQTEYERVKNAFDRPEENVLAQRYFELVTSAQRHVYEMVTGAETTIKAGLSR